MGIKSGYFVGIDPGKRGGLGVLDHRGQFVAAHRWDQKEPKNIYNILLLFNDYLLNHVYLELIQVFPQKEKGFITQNQSTLINLGMWQGFLTAAGLPYLLIHPATWQASQDLTGWAAKQAEGIVCHSPLTLARARWPGAPLEFQADDGKAVGLLLAHMAFRDHQEGIDRAALLEKNREKSEKAKKRKRAKRKAEKEEDFIPWPPAKS